VTSFDLLSKYLLVIELRFDAMLCSIMGKENSDADRIWIVGRRFPTLAPQQNCGLHLITTMFAQTR